MGGPKERQFDDPINVKIQRKFDLIFKQGGGESRMSSKNDSTVLNLSSEDFQFNGDIMSDNAQKKLPEDQDLPSLDFDFGESGLDIENSSSSTEVTAIPLGIQKEKHNVTKPAVAFDNNELEFNLDFEGVSSDFSEVKNSASEVSGLESNELDTMFDDAILESKQNVSDDTQKTILYSTGKVSEVDSFELKDVGITSSLDELMSTEEDKANIESSIHNILASKNSDLTQEFDLFEIEGSEDLKKDSEHTKDSSTEIFDLSSVDFSDGEAPEEKPKEKPKDYTQHSSQNPFQSTLISAPSVHAHINSTGEESGRVLATIRQLREEREELLNQIKNLKGNNRELEQDNLTFKAALDESKIEVSILRKRHMVEIEDIKYRLSLNEEKKEMALEQARQATIQRDKLEQRVRIDFNQVKLREKELETKLEMLTIDVESQVQGRDQKILELRRKIDSLEFNMENISIKEHKLQSEKRKLEDKLNKLMKTLRYSIKNLEDDIDQAIDGSQDKGLDDRQTVPLRSGKA